MGTLHSDCPRANMFFRAEESQLEALENLVTHDPELQEQITEGRIENWGSSPC